METKTTNGLTQRDSNQAIPSPEDRVRALCDWLEDEAIERMKHAMSREESARSMRGATAKDLRDAKVLAEKMAGRRLHGVNTSPEHAALEAEAQDRIATKLATEARQLSAWASLVEELIPFCDSPCGHTSQYAYSEDGGKNIVCLICEREELKWQVAAKEPTPEQIKAIKVGIIKKWQSWIGPLGNPDHYKIQAKMLELEVARETAEAEADLLRKRKDYHAEYVEAVEAAEKAKRERDEYLETGQRIQGDFERAKEAYVCSERELGVMREALRKIGDPGAKVDSLMEARMIARAALTPEPASQAAKEKK